MIDFKLNPWMWESTAEFEYDKEIPGGKESTIVMCSLESVYQNIKERLEKENSSVYMQISEQAVEAILSRLDKLEKDESEAKAPALWSIDCSNYWKGKFRCQCLPVTKHGMVCTHFELNGVCSHPSNESSKVECKSGIMNGQRHCLMETYAIVTSYNDDSSSIAPKCVLPCKYGVKPPEPECEHGCVADRFRCSIIPYSDKYCRDCGKKL